jgi:hypothetical protein
VKDSQRIDAAKCDQVNNNDDDDNNNNNNNNNEVEILVLPETVYFMYENVRSLQRMFCQRLYLITVTL